jgi:transposase InsO family protein
MCDVLKVNRSSAYKIMKHKMSDQEINRIDLESRIIDIYNEFEGIYGAPKIQQELLKQDYYTTVKRISKYMKRLGLRSITTKKYKPVKNEKAPDGKENILEQDFSTSEPNQKWTIYITYVWTVYDGWTYLASVMDMHSKLILGYSYQKHMRKEMVLESLKLAVYKTHNTRGIIVQSDLGSQHLSYEVKEFLRENGILHSYSRKSITHDNSPIEAFHSIIKREKLRHVVLKTFEEAKTVIFKYIEVFYNRKRILGSIDYLTPHEVHYSKREIFT